MPIAIPRCRAGNVLEMIASVAGISSAAPPPCSTRAPISSGPVGASPAASEATLKTARPQRKMRLLPSASASLPPASSKAASASV